MEARPLTQSLVFLLLPPTATETARWSNTTIKPTTTLTAHWVNTTFSTPPQTQITSPTQTETAIWIHFPPSTSSEIDTRPPSSQTATDSLPTTPSDDLPQAITPSPMGKISAEQTGADGNKGLGKGRGDTPDSFVQSSGTDRKLGKGACIIVIGLGLLCNLASAA